ncbi:related to translation elongation factor HBS1 protein [Pseudozyma flocculosa]|uniref:Elongation factor 1 alpha-like protein n=1 Tax=Pseudozyma flocculosa TaxID=84751 RepID=A0A5C3F066_9BASI|nr:related to translation elongation factor HBS1 protein [Pseudozyma flocculosa]
MSRHRAVRNLNLEEELAEDDYYSDEDPYENISSDDQYALAEALSQALSVLGPSENSGISEREIKDALWDSYFDVDSAVNHLVEEKSKREAKLEKDRQKAADPAGTSTSADTPLSELQRLSLRSRQASPSDSPSRGRGGGRGALGSKAMGLAGLGRGGRSSMAKRNLADLAPPQLRSSPAFRGEAIDGATPSSETAGSAPVKPTSKLSALAMKSNAARNANNKRPMEEAARGPVAPGANVSAAGSSAEAPSASRPSKLAALAAARANPGSPRRSPVPERSDPTASATLPPAPVPAAATADTGKPLSKLQQKMAAARQAKAANSEKGSAPKGDAMDVDTFPAASDGPLPTCYGSDIAVDALFPHAAQRSTATSSLATAPSQPGLLAEASCLGSGPSGQFQVAGPFPPTRAVPGGSPFDIFVGASAPAALAQPPLAGEGQIEGLRKAFAGPSPDDVVLKAREAKKAAAAASATNSGASTPLRKKAAVGQAAKAASSGASSARNGSAANVSQLRTDIEAMGLGSQLPPAAKDGSMGSSVQGSSAGGAGSLATTPKVGIAHERIVEEYRKREKEGKSELSLVVVGHVDAGKSTLMGRMLLELGTLSDREYSANERASKKIGKGSFAYAWALDSSEEERERGVTIDVAQDHFSTPHRQFTLLDAPGHRDFIPNMISGAAQADSALLVIDSIHGAFEAGFGPNGQTREHALLVRSLGVQQVVVVVNKLDAVGYSQERYDEIVSKLQPFLRGCGFDEAKTRFVPCGGSVGENLAVRDEGGELGAWYDGPTLVEVLDTLEPPRRNLDGPLRLPVTNVFKGQTAIASGVGVSGRVVSGIVQIGDRLRAVPGDESGIVRAIEVDSDSVPWAVAGNNVTVYLSNIDVIQIAVGSVLCPSNAADVVELCDTFTAQLLVFTPTYPLVQGTAVEVFHHSAEVPGKLVELLETRDKSTGHVIKRHPRVLSRGTTALCRIEVRSGGGAGKRSGVPIESVDKCKDMARILVRRDGETVAAGIVVETHPAAPAGA